MVSESTRNIVMELRAAREARGLSLKELEKMSGLSESSIRRVFVDDLEKVGGYNYDGTLSPLIDLLLMNGDADDAKLSKIRIEGLMDLIRHKDEMIASIKKQAEDARQTQANRCQKCEKDMDYLKHQIDLKDARMDKKDEWIDKLLAQQAELLEKLAVKLL